MSSRLSLFSPQPEPGTVPSEFPDPFGESGPCPLVRRAADELKAALGARGAGRMFGVLVVRGEDDRIGYLSGFAGTPAGGELSPDEVRRFVPGHLQAGLLSGLFAPGQPPPGAGDCAAPRLLAHARDRGLRPIALAEFWWGPPPPEGGRQWGVFYPACRGRCGPLLPLLLRGLPLAPARPFRPPAIDAAAMKVLFEDDRLVVVEKPAGLLSVPGRDPAVTDSVLARLRARCPEATGPLLVHRLDLDTSGLLVATKDPATYALLQRQFLERAVDKRYIAWLEGDVAGDEGLVDLPLRVDLDDRPRQILDPVHGKRAVTAWRVLARAQGRTRVALFPRTGRTHQLRAHAAHARGLGAAIVGDRLYGRAGERLLLHAEALSFVHPGTGRPVTFESPSPF